MMNKDIIEASGVYEGVVGLVEPVVISGKSFGIKLLSVYEFLKCNLAYKNLVEKLASQGFDRDLCKQTCERACIISLSLYNRENQRVFRDGLSVLMGLTPEELKSTYQQYEKLNKKRIAINEDYTSKIEHIKKRFS